MTLVELIRRLRFAYRVLRGENAELRCYFCERVGVVFVRYVCQECSGKERP
jgi:hypothetical protein